MKKFKTLYDKIIKELTGNRVSGFEIPQFKGSLTDYSKLVISGIEPKLDKNKQNRVDCPSKN